MTTSFLEKSQFTVMRTIVDFKEDKGISVMKKNGRQINVESASSILTDACVIMTNVRESVQ